MEDLLGVFGRRVFSRVLEDLWVLLRPHPRHSNVADGACCGARCALGNEIGLALEAVSASEFWDWVRLFRALVERLGSWTRGPAGW